MDSNKRHKIDDFFKENLAGVEMEPDQDYWPLIEPSISKYSFLKFSWTKFNIYYCATALSIIAISTIVYLTKGPSTHKPPQDDNLTLDTLTETPASRSTPQDIVAKADKRLSKNTTLSSQATEKIDTFVVREISSVLEKSDSVTPPNVSVTEVKKEPTPETNRPKKKIIYIVEQDTIIEKDTIRVRRKKKK